MSEPSDADPIVGKFGERKCIKCGKIHSGYYCLCRCEHKHAEFYSDEDGAAIVCSDCLIWWHNENEINSIFKIVKR